MAGVQVVQGMETAHERTMRLLQGAAQSIGGAMAQRRAQQDQELQMSVEMMSRNPELAKTMGPDLVKKHGKRHTWLAPLVDSIGGQLSGQEQFEASVAQAEAASGALDEVERAAQGMPDAVPAPRPFGVPVPAGAPPMMLPNEEKMQALQGVGMARQDPQSLWIQAIAHMPLSDRLAAQNYARVKGIDFPTVDPKELPQNIYAQVFSPQLSPDAQKATAVLNKLQLGAGQMDEQEKLRQQQGAATQRAKLTDQLAAARAEVARKAAQQKADLEHERDVEKIRLRHDLDVAAETTKADKEKPLPKVSGSASDHVKALTTEMKARFGATPENKPYLGHVHQLMSEAQKNAKELGLTDQAGVDGVFQDMLMKYAEGLRQGKSPYAFSLATGKVKSPFNDRAQK